MHTRRKENDDDTDRMEEASSIFVWSEENEKRTNATRTGRTGLFRLRVVGGEENDDNTNTMHQASSVFV